MEPRHRPIVYIDGSPVPTGWEHAREALLDELEIDWGQDNLYEEVPPSVLKLELLWPSGGSILTHQLQDSTVEVELPELGRFLFRGTITYTKWTETYVYDEELQQNRRLWLVRLTAVDAIRDISAFVPKPRDCVEAPNTGSRPTNIIMHTLNQWPFFGSSSTQERSASAMPYSVREDILAAGLVNAIPLRFGSVPNTPQGGFRTFVQEVDAWQLLREVWGTHPLGEPCLEQDTKTVRLQQPTTVTPELRLAYLGGKLVLTLTSPGDPIAGTAGAVRLTGDQLTMGSDPFSIETDQTLNINRVEYETQLAAQTNPIPVTTDSAGNTISSYIGYNMSTEKRGIDVPGGRGKARTYSRRLLMSMASSRYNGELQPAIDMNNNQTIAAHLNSTRNIIAKLNGVIPLPECVVDLEADVNRLPSWVWPMFLSIDPHKYINNPLIVTGSPLTQELSLAYSGQVIGGRLSYQSGWKHRIRFAPVQNEQPSDLRMDQLVTHPTATYNSFADDVTIGELALITQGAS